MKQNRFFKMNIAFACLVFGLVTFTACTPAKVTAPSTFSDPFAYCSAVGNMDQPDASYSGPKMPEAVAKGLQKASGASADAPLELFVSNSFWRCMNGKIYACFVGANLPCESKANTDKTPTAAMAEYCTANPTAENIPAVVTGHDTVYEWGCKDGKPEVIRQVLQVDERGFISDIWYAIEKP